MFWHESFLFVGLALFGCSKQEIICSAADFSGCMVDEIEVIGNREISDDEIRAKIATSETGTAVEGIPIIGALDAFTIEYERLDRYVLERDLMRVERFYRARGFYDAVVRAGRVRRIDPQKHGPNDVSTTRLLVEIIVDEGGPVLVGETLLEWKDWDATKVAEADAGAAAEDAKTRFKRGDPFREDEFEATRQQIQVSLTDIGFAYAKVESKADIDIARHEAKVRYIVELGPRCTFGRVELTGLGPLPEWQLRPALTIIEGERYSTAKRRETERALSNFGVLSTVTIEPGLTKEGPLETKIPMLIRVQPAALGAVRLGGGIELGDQVGVRGIASWQHKNATGALDRFAVEARPRLLLYPWRLTTLFADDPFPVAEVAVRVQYSLPFPFDPKTTLFVQSQAGIGLAANTDPPETLTDETEIRGEYLLEHRQGAERTFFDGRLLGGLSHNLSFSTPFSYQFDKPLADESGSLFISMLQGQILLDLRSNDSGAYDAARPVSGVYASVNMELAGFFLGGDASDFKIRPELRFLAPLAKSLVLAGRVSMGFLVSDNYGFALDDPLSEADVALDGGDSALRTRVNRDLQIFEKRGLYAGGPTSNRGYGFNQISPHRTMSSAGIPLGINADATGGRTSWEGSVELRFPIIGALGGVGFVDAADVTPGLGEVRFDHPHMSLGLGLRYETGVGPLRIDLGYKIPYLQVAGEEDPVECKTGGLAEGAAPCPLIVGEVDRDPIALSIAIGNAF